MILPRPRRFRALRFTLCGGSGPCPEKFRVLYRQDGAWKEATDVKGGFILPDGGWTSKWSKFTFTPVQADAVKLELSLFGTDRSRSRLPTSANRSVLLRGTSTCPIRNSPWHGSRSMDPQGFFAPLGLTTLEQRAMKHPLGTVRRRTPKIVIGYGGPSCTWSGPSWPYSTSITLTGLANLLNGPAQDAIGVNDYFKLLEIYAKAQRLTLDDGRVVPWIDEDQNPMNGDWIARCILLHEPRNKFPERGKDYNHSTFCDLVINGLIGLRPQPDDTVEVNPLVPEGTWDYFCLDQIRYHGYWLTILYDKSGQRYGKGKGLRVFADGKEIAASESLKRVTGTLPTPPHS